MTLSGSGFSGNVTTDSTGAYSIENIPSGTYTLTANGAGLRPIHPVGTDRNRGRNDNGECTTDSHPSIHAHSSECRRR